MALSTLSDIKTAAFAELDRTDLSSVGNDFITLTEGHFNRNLRHRKMVASSDLTPTSNVYTLPTDYLQAIRVVEKASTRRILQGWSPDAIEQEYASRSTGPSAVYTIIGSSLYTFPLSSNDVELIYYQKIPTLVSNDPNWLLTDNPQLYLRGIQLEALIYINETNSSRFQLLSTLVKRLIDEMNAESDLAEYANTAYHVRGATP